MSQQAEHPYPDLIQYNQSNLRFPWAFYEVGDGSFDANLSTTGGVALGAQMLIYWSDLCTAVTALLGYSWRDGSSNTGGTGSVVNATNATPIVVTTGTPHGLSSGTNVTIAGATSNTAVNGTWAITVLSDTTFSVPTTGNGAFSGGATTWTATATNARLKRVLPWQHPYWNQLWVRSISKVQGIRNEGNSFTDPEDIFGPFAGGAGAGYSPNTGPWSEYRLALLHVQFWRPPYYVRSDQDILDSKGQPQEWLRYVDKNWQVNTQMLARGGQQFKWSAGQGTVSAQSSGFPGSVGQKISHLKVKRKWYEIPEQCLFQQSQDQTPQGLPQNLQYTQTATTNPITNYVYAAGQPICGCVNSPIGGGTTDTQNLRLFGCHMGTLMLEGVEITPKPLQLPPYLMYIPFFNNSEPISQQQYDVTFHFDLFDPPRADNIIANTALRGHNLMPWPGDAMWYGVESQNNVGGSGQKGTPLMYADFSDLWKVL